jgi:sugar O-acyltransferase (sialic acid O-acetyltransferase NeuD family)
MTPVNVPWTDVNSETAQVVAWHVDDRSQVSAARSLVDVETSKAALEIEAPADGFVLQLVPAGAAVTVGEPIAYVFPDEAALDAYVAARTAGAAEAATSADGLRATASARQRAEELGVDLSSISRPGLITVKDVEAAAGAAGAPARPDVASLPSPIADIGAARRLLIIGAGLGATQVLDILGMGDEMAGVGIVDDNPDFWGREVGGLPVVGGSERIAELWEARSFDAAVIAISTSVDARARLRQLCRTAGVPLANVMDPTAKIASGASMGTGNVICAFVQLGTQTVLGDNNFISAYNSFDHHNVLGSDISTGPGCMTSGEVHIEDRVRLGTGIFIEPKLTIGEGSVVASGATIVRSVPAGHAVKTKVVTTTVVPIAGARGPT